MSSSSKKKKRSKDGYIIIMPEKVRSLKARVVNRIIQVLKEKPLLSEKEIILSVLAKDEMIKAYYKKTNSISYFRYIIWELAKSKVILKARVLGDKKHVYYFLPEQLPQLKDKIVQQSQM
uniref:hypothetical protein n=1 Tax=Saccharolobus islandicus TaxID=43080 RepID=UPI00159C91A4|nr:hypothetical protein [Sulfolobus islandicus]